MRACIGFFVLLAAAKVAAQSPTSACADGDEVCQSQSDAPSLLQVRDDHLFAPVASVEAKRRSLVQHTATAEQKVAAGKKQGEGTSSRRRHDHGPPGMVGLGEHCDEDWTEDDPDEDDRVCEHPYYCKDHSCANIPVTIVGLNESCDEDWDENNPDPYDKVCQEPYKCDWGKCKTKEDSGRRRRGSAPTVTESSCANRACGCEEPYRDVWCDKGPWCGVNKSRCDDCDGIWCGHSLLQHIATAEQKVAAGKKQGEGTSSRRRHDHGPPGMVGLGEHCDEDWTEDDPDEDDRVCEHPYYCKDHSCANIPVTIVGLNESCDEDWDENNPDP
eukprot:CAMPEP_0180769388 /NCGR_PEP_ID=MMETSP1038_2-20121128/41076_1 /TAXON_ID=632150 /ORGANISM="Azadinium spinosum, Strain 3D9" /LENGTH=328 /DNA_ID=CAMNT_0022804111 /DNA_START=82 /DNA_END=1065 /DNA_ORIENTATION=+